MPTTLRWVGFYIPQVETWGYHIRRVYRHFLLINHTRPNRLINILHKVLFQFLRDGGRYDKFLDFLLFSFGKGFFVVPTLGVGIAHVLLPFLEVGGADFFPIYAVEGIIHADEKILCGAIGEWRSDDEFRPTVTAFCLHFPRIIQQGNEADKRHFTFTTPTESGKSPQPLE